MITSIRLQNFRSYTDEAFEFETGVNIIIGPNGSGKTNLLESLLMACRGVSYRSRDGDMVAHKKDWARIDAYTQTNEHRVVKLKRYNERVIKSFEVNDKPLARLLLNRTVPVVLFEPNQLQLLTTSPDQRRAFLDELLEQTDAMFALDKRAYNRALAQRNRLLKLNPSDLAKQIFVWNIRLSELSSKIVEKRVKLIELFNQSLPRAYQSLANSKDQLQLTYLSKHDTATYGTALLRKFEANLDKEVHQGFTLYGPHRDDMQILLNNQPIQSSASRGEVRTILLGLKMQEVELVSNHRGVKPLLLLDDVFGELDGMRRKMLTDFLDDYQTFITTTDADIVLKNFKHINAIALEYKKK
jgi:DNA replication and repair protein RecF